MPERPISRPYSLLDRSPETGSSSFSKASFSFFASASKQTLRWGADAIGTGITSMKPKERVVGPDGYSCSTLLTMTLSSFAKKNIPLEKERHAVVLLVKEPRECRFILGHFHHTLR